MSESSQVTKRPIDKLKQVLQAPSVQEQFQNALQQHSGLFTASIIALFNSSPLLQKCDPGELVMEALKAATLGLPINPELGFAYIVPYKNKAKEGGYAPVFQVGYKGTMQLAQRSRQYQTINADMVYEGEYKGKNRLTGEVDLSGTKTGETVVGYFAYIETTTGFRKTLFMSVDEVLRHAKQFSKTYNPKEDAFTGPWAKHFDQMALKTVLRLLLGKYGPMSIEMASAIAPETEASFDDVYAAEANTEDFSAVASDDVVDIDPETGEVIPPDNRGSRQMDEEPETEPSFAL